MRTICSWCKKIIAEDPVKPGLDTHGICKGCFRTEMDKFADPPFRLSEQYHQPTNEELRR